MITITDAMNTIEFKDYYVILPSTPLWDREKFRKESNSNSGEYCKDGFTYNSGTNVNYLTVTEIKKLIKDNLL